MKIKGLNEDKIKQISNYKEEDKKTLNELREELNKINSIDNENRKIRDS